ncbi:hypothetical protein M569_07479 [Genlisea aurea]|uniref:RNase H type-1 domain-containing protein n=1 Tax=Genlisea aurea TaxID=192259 RepID=S8E4P2_9LAMI|nr:hypothetical protein M569_07479 [Genlisea aurea]
MASRIDAEDTPFCMAVMSAYSTHEGSSAASECMPRLAMRGCWAIWSKRNEVRLFARSPDVMNTVAFINTVSMLILKFSKTLSPPLDPEHGEYLAAKSGLEFARFLGLQAVTLESDFLALVSAINENVMHNASLFNILDDITALLATFET